MYKDEAASCMDVQHGLFRGPASTRDFAWKDRMLIPPNAGGHFLFIGKPASTETFAICMPPIYESENRTTGCDVHIHFGSAANESRARKSHLNALADHKAHSAARVI